LHASIAVDVGARPHLPLRVRAMTHCDRQEMSADPGT
jgi:hypothetical protein